MGWCRYWYCSGVSEKEAEAMLMKPANVKGSFLVRDGDDSCKCILSAGS